MQNGKTEYFREEQRFTQYWIRLPVILLAVLLWYGFIRQILLGKPWGTKPAPDPVLITFWILFGIILPYIFLSLKMITEVGSDNIRIRFFISKTIRLTDLKSFKIITYRPLREYGGWGIRYGGKKGWAYNVSGNRGVLLELKNFSRILIGSQKPEELYQAIETGCGGITPNG